MSPAGSEYDTRTSPRSSKWNDVSEHSVHWRLRGSWTNDRFSADRRATQMGSWWETSTASWPWAAIARVEDARASRRPRRRTARPTTA
jgi:hypothetical protein